MLYPKSIQFETANAKKSARLHATRLNWRIACIILYFCWMNLAFLRFGSVDNSQEIIQKLILKRKPVLYSEKIIFIAKS
jgi:hypothetical protein